MKTVPQWAKAMGLSVASLRYWVKKLRVGCASQLRGQHLFSADQMQLVGSAVRRKADEWVTVVM